MDTRPVSALEMLGLAGYHVVERDLLLQEMSRPVRREAAPVPRWNVATLAAWGIAISTLIYIYAVRNE